MRTALTASSQRTADNGTQSESDASGTEQPDRRVSGLVMGSQVPTLRTGRSSSYHLPQIAPPSRITVPKNWKENDNFAADDSVSAATSVSGIVGFSRRPSGYRWIRESTALPLHYCHLFKRSAESGGRNRFSAIRTTRPERGPITILNHSLNSSVAFPQR